MMLVVSGDSGVRLKDLAGSLAVELGWRSVDADEFRFVPLRRAASGGPLADGAPGPSWVVSLHRTMAFAQERRESLVVICPPLTDAQRESSRLNLGGQAPVDLVVDVDPHAPPERALGEIRREFGV